jgi:hypothetical protein
MSDFDPNINNYTIVELLTILNINDPTEDNIIYETEKYINQLSSQPEIQQFFQDMQDRLLNYISSDPPQDEPSNNQLNNWYKNEALPQNNNPVQKDKITDRKQQIDVFNNTHVPMNRNQLGISNNYNVPISQDTLNPKLENTIQRIINLDSKYRQTASLESPTTDYTLDLSEPLLNTLSLRLYSFQIPYTWYTIDNVYGNTCFWISFPDSSGNISFSVNITIAPGNYSPTVFVSTLNTLLNSLFTFPTLTPITWNSNNNKITMNLYGGVYKQNTLYIINYITIITFFDPTARLTCNSYTQTCQTSNSINSNFAINQTLGWVMGYRLPSIIVDSSGNIAPSILDLNGPKYLILVIDDYNQNHINNGLIGITELSKTLKLPSYYTPDMPYTCIPPNPNGSNLLQNSLGLTNNENAGTLIVEKLNTSYTSTVQVLPSAPRILTQAQIYSINQIMKNNGQNHNYRLSAPTNTDTFAIIPTKLGTTPTGGMFTDTSGPLQDNKRVYFGPVNIDRMKIQLLDDKGNILNLNGADWSITLISENLYQY